MNVKGKSPLINASLDDMLTQLSSASSLSSQCTIGALAVGAPNYNVSQNDAVTLIKVAKLIPDDILEKLTPLLEIYRIYNKEEVDILKLALSITKENQAETVKKLRLML